jgi:Uncharacterized conserved protein
MIFVTVGTQFGFDRLIEWMDEWAASSNTDVFAQIGEGSFQPRHISWTRDIPAADFSDYVQRAEKVVSHAGMGTIISSLLTNKPIIIVPRMASLGEHRNDHQLATAMRFSNMPGIRVAHDKTMLFEHLSSAHHENGYDSSGNLLKLIQELTKFIEKP